MPTAVVTGAGTGIGQAIADALAANGACVVYADIDIETAIGRLGPPLEILLRVLPPVETQGLSSEDVAALTDRVRGMIVNQIASWRNDTAASVAALAHGGPRTP